MRYAVIIALTSLLAACDSGPSFAEVQMEDTIEAYEGFLAAAPETLYKTTIDKRLEELYFAQAEAGGTREGYELYLTKFPEGENKKASEKALMALDWTATLSDNTVEAYKAFIEKYPKAGGTMKARAQGMVKVAEYGKLTVGEPKIEQVNMAEDPKGEKNGWGVFAEFKNEGDKPLAYVNVSLEFLADDGSLLERKDWPLVSPTWNVPVEEIATQPMKPGETRKWEWTVAFESIPEGWNQKVKVYPSGLTVEGG